MKREYFPVLNQPYPSVDGVDWPLQSSLEAWDEPPRAGAESDPSSDVFVGSYEEALRRRVRLFFAASHFLSLRHIDISVHGDTVVLRGELRTFYEKQMAVQFAARVAGVIHVVDRILVRTPLARPLQFSWTADVP